MNYINKIYIGRKGSYWENSIIKVISNMTNNAVMCKIILDKTFKKVEETIFYKSSIAFFEIV